jgi:hypothetical protein
MTGTSVPPASPDPQRPLDLPTPPTAGSVVGETTRSAAPVDIGRLVDGMARWLPRFARRMQQVVLIMSWLAGLTGAAALLVGLWAWHDPLVEAAVPLIFTVPAVVAPFMAARRIRPLAAAVSQPEETARQARSYFAGLTQSPELDELIRRAAASRGRGESLKVGGAWRTSRLLGKVVGKVSPDPDTQPLVAAVAPANLKVAWFWVIVSWWAWIVAMIVGFAAAASLAVDAII